MSTRELEGARIGPACGVGAYGAAVEVRCTSSIAELVVGKEAGGIGENPGPDARPFKRSRRSKSSFTTVEGFEVSDLTDWM